MRHLFVADNCRRRHLIVFVRELPTHAGNTERAMSRARNLMLEIGGCAFLPKSRECIVAHGQNIPPEDVRQSNAETGAFYRAMRERLAGGARACLAIRVRRRRPRSIRCGRSSNDRGAMG